MVAGTVVIAEHYEHVPFSPANIPNRPGMEELKHLMLKTEERDLLHLYLARKMYLPDEADASVMKHWAEYLSKKWQIDASLIDDKLLAGLLQINEVKY